MRISDWSSDVCSSDLIVLPQIIQAEKIASIANAIILSLAKPFAIEGEQVRIGSSVGIAVADGAAVSAAPLVRNAALALYAAPEAGRGVYRFFAAALHDAAPESKDNTGRASGRDRACQTVCHPVSPEPPHK